MSNWTITPMAQAEAEEVAAWRHPGEYAIYDADSVPDGLAELLDRARAVSRPPTATEVLRSYPFAVSVPGTETAGARGSFGIRYAVSDGAPPAISAR